MNKQFNVGIYLRLSREDDDYKEESSSITNQRNYILNYLKNNNNLNFVDEYIDDGFSGGDFDRPAFKRMLIDIEYKKIDCVIVKDQSRLGRNDLVPYYIRQFFPLKKVRFIAINSDIDTFDENKIGNKMIGFYSIMNTHYCIDISEKVKSTLNTKKKEGKHLGGTACYGYKKDPNNKYKLIIDEKAAKVVKMIFNLFVNGNSLQMIARHLDDLKIPIPSIYKNLNRGMKSTMYGHWQTRTIDEILKNEMYIGNMCQGKRKRIAVNIKHLIRNPKNKWIIVKNTHEPIIDKEIFDMVQSIYSKNSHITKNTNKYLLKGFIFCKECSHTIGINTVKNKGYLVCNYYRKYSKLHACTPHRMKYDYLESIVLNKIKQQIKNCNQNELIYILKRNNKIELKIEEIIKENKKLKIEIKDFNRKNKEIYNDKLNKIISKKIYLEMKNQITKEKIENEKKLKENFDNIKKLKTTNINYEKIVDDFMYLKNINRKIISYLIDKIIIDENLNIEIFYKFKL